MEKEKAECQTPQVCVKRWLLGQEGGGLRYGTGWRGVCVSVGVGPWRLRGKGASWAGTLIALGELDVPLNWRGAGAKYPQERKESP